MSSEPAMPEVWWSPGMGLLEEVSIVGDEALYECLNADEGRGDLLHHLPSDAVELVAAPSEDWCDQMHERDQDLEQLRRWVLAVTLGRATKDMHAEMRDYLRRIGW